MELILTHDGDKWTADGGGWRVHGRTLEELDRRLVHCLDERGEFRHRQQLRVAMRFDMATLPRWLHQYTRHYFNRVVTFDRPRISVSSPEIGEGS